VLCIYLFDCCSCWSQVRNKRHSHCYI